MTPPNWITTGEAIVNGHRAELGHLEVVTETPHDAAWIEAEAKKRGKSA